MTVSIGVVANIYNEANALPGWLECASSWADSIDVYHAGPGGAYSNDGTMEILEKWKVPVHRGSIDEGFGIVRTAAVRSSPCEWVMILDADERFYRLLPQMTCGGEETPQEDVDRILGEYTRVIQGYDSDTGKVPSNFENVHRLGDRLSVTFGAIYDQVAALREALEHHTTVDAVATVRRHWHDFSFRRPTQNWHRHPDYQLRIVRNTPHVHFEPNVRMHETLVGASNRLQPNQAHGPFFDHHHLFFKRLEAQQRAHDLAIYNAIHACRKPPTWEEFRGEKS